MMRPVWIVLLLAALSFLGGCAEPWRDAVPGQSQLLCYEDGSHPGDPVRVFAGVTDLFVVIATTGPLEAEAVKEATHQAFARRPYAMVGIVYQYRGDQILKSKVVHREE